MLLLSVAVYTTSANVMESKGTQTRYFPVMTSVVNTRGLTRMNAWSTVMNALLKLFQLLRKLSCGIQTWIQIDARMMETILMECLCLHHIKFAVSETCLVFWNSVSSIVKLPWPLKQYFEMRYSSFQGVGNVCYW